MASHAAGTTVVADGLLVAGSDAVSAQGQQGHAVANPDGTV